jgi:hypothetical protein
MKKLASVNRNNFWLQQSFSRLIIAIVAMVYETAVLPP